jgi:long-chain fatty acid transport protein
MKKLSLLVVLAMVLSSTALFAAGVNHNINHSAEFIGMMNRNASQEADAVFFNPAGTTAAKDGLLLYVSNQFIFQTRTLEDSSSAVAGSDPMKSEYKGTTTALLFPNVYAIYKMDKLALFAGFAPVGGGGTAKFDDGLPAFYWAMVGASALAGQPATSINQSFEGSSAFLMGQVGAAYEVDPMVSVALGAKYVYAMESYKGDLKWTAGLAGPQSIALDNERNGQCYGAVVGLNLKPMQGLNVGLRYEWYSKLELENDTTIKTSGLVAGGLVTNPAFAAKLADLQDGEKSVNTLPQVIGLGIGYQILPELATQVSVNYALNKQVKEYKDGTNNAYDLGIGFEYKVMEGLKARLGYLYAKASEKDEANTELSYGLDSHSFGLGATYTAMPGLDLTLGASYTYYASKKIDSSKNPLLGGTVGEVELGKSTMDFAIGVTYKAM